MAATFFDREKTEAGRIAETIARGIDRHPCPRRYLSDCQRAFVTKGNFIGDDLQGCELSGREMTGKSRRHGAGGGKAPTTFPGLFPIVRSRRLFRTSDHRPIPRNIRSANARHILCPDDFASGLDGFREALGVSIGQPPCPPFLPQGVGNLIEAGQCPGFLDVIECLKGTGSRSLVIDGRQSHIHGVIRPKDIARRIASTLTGQTRRENLLVLLRKVVGGNVSGLFFF